MNLKSRGAIITMGIGFVLIVAAFLVTPPFAREQPFKVPAASIGKVMRPDGKGWIPKILQPGENGIDVRPGSTLVVAQTTPVTFTEHFQAGKKLKLGNSADFAMDIDIVFMTPTDAPTQDWLFNFIAPVDNPGLPGTKMLPLKDIYANHLSSLVRGKVQEIMRRYQDSGYVIRDIAGVNASIKDAIKGVFADCKVPLAFVTAQVMNPQQTDPVKVAPAPKAEKKVAKTLPRHITRRMRQ